MKKYGYIYKFTFLPKNLIYIGKRNRCGKNNPAYGKRFYNNGSIQVLAYECPEGFVKGMLKKRKESDANETVD